VGATKAFPKIPQERVVLGPYGFVGDAHAEPRQSKASPGDPISGDRAISIVADEVRREVNGNLGLDLQPGDFNENVLVVGLGDLGDLVPGDRLIFSGGAEVQITAQNPPCEAFESYGGAGLIKATTFKDENGVIHNMHGVMASVAQTGEIRPEDIITVRRQ
jgi:MOSC domain-containing protein YiiM